ncbi:hypothetical protein NQZ68_013987 [Dissostichus eleginoides]|nr:hypothetical protein NQZ68_013987 [Dissostichus eleginoides]
MLSALSQRCHVLQRNQGLVRCEDKLWRTTVHVEEQLPTSTTLTWVSQQDMLHCIKSFGKLLEMNSVSVTGKQDCWHGYYHVMQRKSERANGMAGSVDRWLVQLRLVDGMPTKLFTAGQSSASAAPGSLCSKVAAGRCQSKLMDVRIGLFLPAGLQAPPPFQSPELVADSVRSQVTRVKLWTGEYRRHAAT